MTVKEILLSSAVYVNNDGIVEYIKANFSSSSQIAKKDFDCLLGVLNVVLNEISAYVPLITEEDVNQINNKVFYSSLSNNIIKVLDVLDEKGNSLKFNEEVEYVLVNGLAKSIKYAYSPKTLIRTDDIPYSEWQVPASIIVYGVVAEYCIYEARYDEAVLWNKKFINGIEECANKYYKTKGASVKNSKIKGREFI